MSMFGLKFEFKILISELKESMKLFEFEKFELRMMSANISLNKDSEISEFITISN